MKAIVAAAFNNAIGIGNEIPWHISDDFKHFQEVTKHNVIVMGRKTYESIGRSLPYRQMVVLTTQKDYKTFSEKDIVINDMSQIDDIIERFSPTCETFIAGGGEIYKKLFDRFSTIYMTKVSMHVDGADAFFPSVNVHDWTVNKCRKPHTTDEDVTCNYFRFTRNLKPLPKTLNELPEHIQGEFSEFSEVLYKHGLDVFNLNNLPKDVYDILKNNHYDVCFTLDVYND